MDRAPLPAPAALAALARCAARVAALLARRRLHQSRDRVGRRLHFADGTSARVYRETVVEHVPADPVLLVVGFRLRRVRHPRWHAAFRTESLLNTVLFAGFPGFVSKLWLAHDDHHLYRGVYEWDGEPAARRYVRALWWALVVVSVRSSIDAHVVAGVRRDAVVEDPSVLDPLAPERGQWWRPVRAPEGAERHGSR